MHLFWPWAPFFSIYRCSTTAENPNKTWYIIDVLICILIIGIWSYALFDLSLVMWTSWVASQWFFVAHLIIIHFYIYLIVIVCSSIWCFLFFIAVCFHCCRILIFQTSNLVWFRCTSSISFWLTWVHEGLFYCLWSIVVVLGSKFVFSYFWCIIWILCFRCLSAIIRVL